MPKGWHLSVMGLIFGWMDNYDPPHSRRYPRSDAEMAAKLGVMIRLEGETVTVMPKPEERAEDAFDLVRMKR